MGKGDRIGGGKRVLQSALERILDLLATLRLLLATLAVSVLFVALKAGVIRLQRAISAQSIHRGPPLRSFSGGGNVGRPSQVTICGACRSFPHSGRSDRALCYLWSGESRDRHHENDDLHRGPAAHLSRQSAARV